MHYDIIRSNRRTMALEITREGRVVIRAPKTMPQSRIDDFYQSHTDWIQTHLQRQQAWQQAHPEPDAATEQALRRQARIILPKRWHTMVAECSCTPQVLPSPVPEPVSAPAAPRADCAFRGG